MSIQRSVICTVLAIGTFSQTGAAQTTRAQCIAAWGPFLAYGIYDTDIITQTSEYHRRFAHLITSEEGQDRDRTFNLAGKADIPLEEIVVQTEGSASAQAYDSFHRKSEDYITDAIDAYFREHTDRRHINRDAITAIANACNDLQGVYASWTESPDVPNFRVRVFYAPEHDGPVNVTIPTTRGAHCSTPVVRVSNNQRTGHFDCVRRGPGAVYLGLNARGADWIGPDEVRLPTRAAHPCGLSALSPLFEQANGPVKIHASEDEYTDVTVCPVENTDRPGRGKIQSGVVSVLAAITGNGSGEAALCYESTGNNSCPEHPHRVKDRYSVQVTINGHYIGLLRWSRSEMIPSGYTSHALSIPDSVLGYVHVGAPNVVGIGVRNAGTHAHIPPDKDPLDGGGEMAMYFTNVGILVSR